MPGGDRTGPMGAGPMTGRAAGLCTGNVAPGFANTPGGRGFGGGGGGFGGGRGGGGGGGGGGGRGGRGRRNRFHATGLTGWQRAEADMPAVDGGQVVPDAQPEPDVASAVGKGQALGVLKQQAESMRQQMEQLRERIEQLETED